MILKFVTGAASSAVPVRTLLDWNVDDPLPDVARRNPAAARVSGASRRGPRVREWRECPSPQVLNRARRVGVSLLQRCAVRIRGSSTAQSGRVRGSLAMTCDDGAYAAVIRQAVGPGPSLGARHERDHRRQRALPLSRSIHGWASGGRATVAPRRQDPHLPPVPPVAVRRTDAGGADQDPGTSS
jgi:hypothetical protein